MKRFSDDKHFASYCQLAPGSADSGGRHKLKHVPKDGNGYLKYVFTESALKAIIYYVGIKQFYESKLRKTNAPVARTIVAKELARIVYYVLTREEPFKSFKGIAVNKSESWPRL
ncbi:IS110 family transposase, partial [bacterium]|nr:IS110 family transposase [bacterium]